MDDNEGIMVVGIWINTDRNPRYEGGKNKGLLVSRNVTLSELKQKIHVLSKGEGVDANVELKYPTPLSQMGRTYIEIEDDGDLKYFLKYNRDVIQSNVVPLIASIQCIAVQSRGGLDVNGYDRIIEAVDNANRVVQSSEGHGGQQQLGRQRELVNEESIGHKQANTEDNSSHDNDAVGSICEGNDRGNLKMKHVRPTSYNHRPQDIAYAKGLGG